LILVTRLNGPVFALNPDLVERADCTPDTVITLVDGTKYVISESVPEFIALVRHYRASVIASAQRMETDPVAVQDPTGYLADKTHLDAAGHDAADGTAKIVPLHRRDR
jgi:flagellar protein FlbD